jgi:hypothetical protein
MVVVVVVVVVLLNVSEGQRALALYPRPPVGYRGCAIAPFPHHGGRVAAGGPKNFKGERPSEGTHAAPGGGCTSSEAVQDTYGYLLRYRQL